MQYLDKLHAVVQNTYHSKHTSWYRDICTENGIYDCPAIDCLNDIKRLPLLCRSELNMFAPEERLSLPSSFAHDIRSTSGTSGQLPLFYYRTTYYKQMAQQLVKYGARRKLYLWGYQHVITHIENDRLQGLQTIICDPQQLPHHVRLVSRLKIDTLAGTPSLLVLFGRLFETIDDRLQIRYLELTGEPGRDQTLAALKDLFPLAKTFHHYAMGEMGQETGIRTPFCHNQNHGYYHLNSDGLYAENIDGELVLTQLHTPTCFPLIRYKTGDRIEWLRQDECACGHTGVSFELSGRANVDFVRIAGVELRYEEITAIVDNLNLEIEPYLAVEVTENIIAGRQAVTITVIVVCISQNADYHSNIVAKIREALAEQLKLSATTMLKDMIAAGLFTKPEIKVLNSVPIETKAPGIKYLTSQ